MMYEEWLAHFNPNHDPRNGQFTRKQAGAIVKSAKKAIKKGIYTDEAKPYINDIKSMVDDKELNRLISKVSDNWSDYQSIHYDWRDGLASDKELEDAADRWHKALDEKDERAFAISKNVLNTMGIHDEVFETRLMAIIGSPKGT